MKFSLQQVILIVALCSVLLAWWLDHSKLAGRSLVNVIEIGSELQNPKIIDNYVLAEPKWESSENEPSVSAAEARRISEKLIEEIGEIPATKRFESLRLRSMNLMNVCGNDHNYSDNDWCYLLDIVGLTRAEQNGEETQVKAGSRRAIPHTIYQAAVLMDGSIHSIDFWGEGREEQIVKLMRERYPWFSPKKYPSHIVDVQELSRKKGNEVAANSGESLAETNLESESENADDSVKAKKAATETLQSQILDALQGGRKKD